jgi:hypothetical protein
MTTKFNLGDTVWFMHENRARTGEVAQAALRAERGDPFNPATFDETYAIDCDSPSDFVVKGPADLFRIKQELLESL